MVLSPMSTTEVERIEAHRSDIAFDEHLARYRFATQQLHPGRILDMACGTGYGTDLLANIDGAWVIGADVDVQSVCMAKAEYRESRFSVASGTALPFHDNVFQSIISLETIEHIQDDEGYLQELARVLADDGVCLISTPNRAYSESRHIINPYHVREYLADELCDLLERYFHVVKLNYQGFSETYHEQIAGYSGVVGSRKQKLGAPLKLVMRAIYQPVRGCLPLSLKNYAIRRLLRVEFPQPTKTDIVIRDMPVTDTRNFVAVCRIPRK